MACAIVKPVRSAWQAFYWTDGPSLHRGRLDGREMPTPSSRSSYAINTKPRRACAFRGRVGLTRPHWEPIFRRQPVDGTKNRLRLSVLIASARPSKPGFAVGDHPTVAAFVTPAQAKPVVPPSQEVQSLQGVVSPVRESVEVRRWPFGKGGCSSLLYAKADRTSCGGGRGSRTLVLNSETPEELQRLNAV